MLVRLNKILPTIVRCEAGFLVSTIAGLKSDSIISLYPQEKRLVYVEVMTEGGQWDKGPKEVTTISFEGLALFALSSDLEGAWQEVSAL